MRIVIRDESHNRVDWEVRTPILKLVLGAMLIWAFLSSVIILSNTTWRQTLLIGVGAVALGIVCYLLFVPPVSEVGNLERTLDGGTVTRIKRWLVRRQHVVCEVTLKSIAEFQMETEIFEELGGDTYRLARLWASLKDGSAVLLTGWSDPTAVEALGASLAKAGWSTFVV